MTTLDTKMLTREENHYLNLENKFMWCLSWECPSRLMVLLTLLLGKKFPTPLPSLLLSLLSQTKPPNNKEIETLLEKISWHLS